MNDLDLPDLPDGSEHEPFVETEELVSEFSERESSDIDHDECSAFEEANDDMNARIYAEYLEYRI